MAEIHLKFADCLKSEKSMGDCREEMMKNCNNTMKKGACPMWSMGRMDPRDLKMQNRRMMTGPDRADPYEESEQGATPPKK